MLVQSHHTFWRIQLLRLCSLVGLCDTGNSPMVWWKLCSGSHWGGEGHCDIHSTCQILPRVKSFDHVGHIFLVERWRGEIGFSGYMNVDWLEIDGPNLFFFFIFLAQITIWWHQVTGSPIGTCSSIPSQTSLSSPAFKSSCQWMGSGTGEWYAESSVFGSIINLIGGPSIMGSCWCSHVLGCWSCKDQVGIALISFKFLQWLGVGGLLAGLRAWYVLATDNLWFWCYRHYAVHCMCSSCDSPPVVGCVCVSPTFGKLSDIMPMSIHASLIRNSLSVLVLTYVTWCVSRYFPDWSFPDSLRMTVPRMLISHLSAACIFMLIEMRSLQEISSFFFSLSPGS